MSRRQQFEFDGLYEEGGFEWDIVNVLRAVVFGLVLCVVAFEFGTGVAFTDRCTVVETHFSIGCDLEFQCESGARHRGSLTVSRGRNRVRCLYDGEQALANPFWWDTLRNDGPFSFFPLSFVAAVLGGGVAFALGRFRPV